MQVLRERPVKRAGSAVTAIALTVGLTLSGLIATPGIANANEDLSTPDWVAAQIEAYAPEKPVATGTSFPEVDIIGTPTVGTTLTAIPKNFESTQGIRYEWMSTDLNASEGSLRLDQAATSTPTYWLREKDRDRILWVFALQGSGVNMQRAANYTIVKAATEQNLGTITLAGGIQVGSTQTVSTFGWAEGTAFTYEWFVDEQRIESTSTTIPVLPSYAGKRVKVVVTGRHSSWLPTSRTLSAPLIVKGTITPRPVVLMGEAVVGGTLSVAPDPGWVKNPASYSFQWLNGNDSIAGATGADYTPTADDVGDAVSVRVSVSAEGYENASLVSESRVVAAPEIRAEGVVNVDGDSKVGNTLTARPTGWVEGSTFSYQWLSGGSEIYGATAATLALLPVYFLQEISVRLTVTAPGGDPVTVISDIRTVQEGDAKPGKIKIDGFPTKGSMLWAVEEAWPGDGVMRYEWLRDGKVIDGATTGVYFVSDDDTGTKLSVRATSERLGYALSTRESEPVTVVRSTLKFSPESAKPDEQLIVSGSNFMPGGSYRVMLDTTATSKASPTGLASPTELGKVMVNPQGEFALLATIPAETKPGKHTVSVVDPERNMTLAEAMLDVVDKVAPPAVKYTVKYNLAGGSGSFPAATVTKGAKVTAPARVPTRKGYTFDGWKDAKGKIFDFSKAITSNLTLTAGWRVESGTHCSAPREVAVFADTPVKHQFYKEIDWMSCMKVTTGTKQASGKPMFRPGDVLTRAAMAAFVFRMEAPKDYVAPRVSPFADVKPGDRFYREISWMFESGLSTGWNDPAGKPSYLPNANLSREAMAAFIYRLEAPKGYVPPKASPLADMKPGMKFYREISWMYEQGLTSGTKTASGKKFYPKNDLSRQAMAAFIYRLEHKD